MLVDAAGEEGRQDRAAAGGHGFQAGGEVALDHVQGGREDHVVGREVGGLRDDVHVGTGLAGGPVVGVDHVRVLDQPGGSVGDLQGPPAVPVEEEGGAGRGAGAERPVAQDLQLPAQFGDLAEDAGVVAARVADDGPVVLLAGAAGGTHLEVEGGVGAVGDGLEGGDAEFAGSPERVDVPAGRRRGGLLHQPEGGAVLQSAHQVVGEGGPGRRGVEGRVVVPGGEVQVGRPAVVVEGAVEAHEVGGDGRVRVVGADRLLLGQEAAEEGVGGEAEVVEGDALEGRVVGAAPVFGESVRRLDLVPVGVAVGPEGGPPGVVEGLEGAVPVPQPLPERLGAQVAVTGAAVLVVDVPGEQGRVAGVPFGEARDECGGVLAVGR